jgi:hypothetical protein
VKGYAWNFWIETANGSTTLSYDYRVSCRTSGGSMGAVTAPTPATSTRRIQRPGRALRADRRRARLPQQQRHLLGDRHGLKESLSNGAVPSPNEGADFDNDGEIDMCGGGNTGGSYAASSSRWHR